MKLSRDTLDELLAYHYDRRNRVYDFLGSVKPEDFTRDLPIGWGSLRGLVLHALEAEVFWVRYGMQQGERPSWDYDDYPDVAAVRTVAASVREATQRFLATPEAHLDRPHTVTFSSGAQMKFTTAKGFLHIITHDAHHRGQVLVVARQMGYEPPEIDLM